MEVTAEQAESALGRTMATELDVEISDTVDADTNEEEDGMDYSCLAWQPGAPSMGWEADRPARLLSRADFACTASEISGKLQKGSSASVIVLVITDHL